MEFFACLAEEIIACLISVGCKEFVARSMRDHHIQVNMQKLSNFKVFKTKYRNSYPDLIPKVTIICHV